MAWFKKKIDAVTDPDQLPGTTARLIEVLARNGMDTATRNTCAATTRRASSSPRPSSTRSRSAATSSPHCHPPAGHAQLHTPEWARTDQDILRARWWHAGVHGAGRREPRRLAVYLALTSRLFAEPVNIVVKGLSSSGKSYVVECVILLFPPEAVY